jgi:hypothetical protein
MGNSTLMGRKNAVAKRPSVRTSSARSVRKIVVCGGGNAGHALAVACSQTPGVEIGWLVATEERADTLRQNVRQSGLRSTGVVTGRAKRLGLISCDAREVVPGADLVLIAVPAYAHAFVLHSINPYLDDTVSVGCLPTRGGFDFEAVNLLELSDRRRLTLFGLQTLPWSTRVTVPGAEVGFGAVKTIVLLAATPASRAPELARALTALLGTRIEPTSSFVSLTLGNPGQFIHPGLMYGHFRAWRGEHYSESSVPRFYADATEEMGEIVESLSRDARAVAMEVERRSEGLLRVGGVSAAHEWLIAAYSHVTADTTSVARCFRTGPIQARLAPMKETAPGRYIPDFEYRYLTEDVPYGLVVTRSIAELVGVPTPMIDAVIQWAQSVLGRSYLVDGSADRADSGSLPLPQNYGVEDARELIEWYSDLAAGRPRARLAVSPHG